MGHLGSRTEFCATLRERSLTPIKQGLSRKNPGTNVIPTLAPTRNRNRTTPIINPQGDDYEGNSISKLQIQVATYVFELSAGNCLR